VVREVLQSGWSISSPTNGYHSITVGPSATNVDFVNTRLRYSISGYKFNDLNKSGTWDTGEPGLADWTIELRDSSGTLLNSVNTDSDGSYIFSNLLPAMYRVDEILKDGWTKSYPTTAYHTVTITNANVENVNFGNYYSALPILNITKTDSPDPVQAGSTLTYTIEYWNSGNADATNVVITETYDSNVTFSSAVPSPDTGNNVWNIGTLSPSLTHSSITITVTVKSPLPNGTVIHNVVSIDSSETEPVQATADTTVGSAPVLNITKTDSPDPVQAGSTLTYTIEYWNSGNADATNVVITETYD
ncbi:MAG: DUF11 domain-containing protein, partial [Bacteroidales bacterium]|nr:DUF11 domain-containing protein [Bacteroidales bacterium]